MTTWSNVFQNVKYAMQLLPVQELRTQSLEFAN